MLLSAIRTASKNAASGRHRATEASPVRTASENAASHRHRAFRTELAPARRNSVESASESTASGREGDQSRGSSNVGECRLWLSWGNQARLLRSRRVHPVAAVRWPRQWQLRCQSLPGQVASERAASSREVRPRQGQLLREAFPGSGASENAFSGRECVRGRESSDARCGQVGCVGECRLEPP